MQNISSKFYTDNIAVSINTIVEACVQDLENVNLVIDGLAALAYKSKISQSDLDTALSTLINEKAEKSTVTTLTSQLSTLNGAGTGSIQKQINDAINKFATQVSDDGVINSFKELVDWAQTHGSEIGEITAAVTNLEHLMGDIGGDGKPATVAAAIEAQITKNNGNYYTKHEADAKYLTSHQSLANYYTKTQADTAFQPKGSYQTTAGMSSYYTKTQVDAAFQPKGNYLTSHQSLTNYYTKTEADGKYQPKGSYLTSHQSLSNYYTKAQADSSFQPAGDYLTLADANTKYQPKGTYLTAHQSLANYYTKTESETKFQPKGNYLTTHQSLANYYTKTEADGKYQPKGSYLTAHQSLANYMTINTVQTITGTKQFKQVETKFVAPSLTYTDPWSGAICAIKVTGKVATNDAIRAGSFIKVNGTSAQFLKADGTVDSKPYIAPTLLADATDINALMDNGLFYTPNDGSTTTMKNVPFNQTFAMLSYTNYNSGTDIRRSRFAWDGFGNMKVFNDRDLAGNGGAWYDVLTSRFTKIANGVITINGVSITPLTSHQSLTNYYTKSEADSKYQPKGSYLTSHQSLANYYTKTQTDSKYQPKGSYLTSHQSLANYVTLNSTQTISGIKIFSAQNGIRFVGGQTSEKFRRIIETINSSIGVAERDYKWQILHSSEPTWRGLYICSYDGNNKIFNQIAGFEAVPENRFRVLGKIKGKAFIKDDGTATQFLKADGSVDSTAYVNKAGDTMTGTLGVKNTLNINSSEIINHIALNRAGHNYITATRSGGIIALTSNGKAPNSESGELYISNNVVYPGKDSTIQLGTSGKKWRQSHVVQSYVYGRLIVSRPSGDCRILIGNQDSAGVNNPFVIKSQNGMLELGVGNSWSGVDGGTFTQLAVLNRAFIQAPGFKKTGGTNTQILLANGEVGTLWKAADLTTSTTDSGVVTPKFVGSAIAKFGVASLGTSGNYLTWTKNGTANNLTVPYASKAGVIAMPPSSEITKHPGHQIASFISCITSSTTGLFPCQDNANALLTINTHAGNYIHQLGFSGNNQMYHRAFHGVAIDTSTAWNKILTSANYATVLDTRYIQKIGGISGDLMLNNDSSTGIRQVKLQCANTDFGRIAVGGTASNGGWLEIATADDGLEPIYVRQYSGAYTAITRTATLLDASGNTTFPGKLTIQTGAGTAPIKVTSTTVCPSLNADMLDGTHKSGLLTALTASGNRITCTVGGTSKSCDINSVGGLTVYKFMKPGNSGNPCYILISDVTNWYNQGTSGINGGHHGIIGTVISDCAGNMHATFTASIIAMCSYNRNYYKLQTNEPRWIKPMLVKYNNKYYIALFCMGSGHDFYVIGRGYDVSTIQTLNADFDGLVSGLVLLQQDAISSTGIDVLVDRNIYFNNRDSQYSIRAMPTSNMRITTPPMKGIILNGGLICVESGDVLFTAPEQKVYLLNYAKLLEQGLATIHNLSDFIR